MRKHAVKAPLILVSSETENKGREFDDFALSLSVRYETALLNAGAYPWVLPATNSPRLIAEIVSRADGVMLTGGEDVQPGLYEPEMPRKLRATVKVTPDGGLRDHRELLVIKEALRQGKALLAICRGQQVLNVAMGGTLVPDLPTCHPCTINHRQMDKRSDIAHRVQLTPGSLLDRISGGLQEGVNSTHHQSVGRLGEGLVASAMSPDGVVEAVELQPQLAKRAPFLLGVQFHPERLEDRFPGHRAIFKAFVSACSKDNL